MSFVFCIWELGFILEVYRVWSRGMEEIVVFAVYSSLLKKKKIIWETNSLLFGCFWVNTARTVTGMATGIRYILPVTVVQICWCVFFGYFWSFFPLESIIMEYYGVQGATGYRNADDPNKDSKIQRFGISWNFNQAGRRYLQLHGWYPKKSSETWGISQGTEKTLSAELWRWQY